MATTRRTNRDAPEDALERHTVRDNAATDEAALGARQAQVPDPDHRGRVDAATTEVLRRWGGALDRLGEA